MMEAAVNFYQITRRNIPEDCHFHARHRENLKSHKTIYFYKGSEFVVTREIHKRMSCFEDFVKVGPKQ
jgi:hypothetical protein